METCRARGVLIPSPRAQRGEGGERSEPGEGPRRWPRPYAPHPPGSLTPSPLPLSPATAGARGQARKCIDLRAG